MSGFMIGMGGSSSRDGALLALVFVAGIFMLAPTVLAEEGVGILGEGDETIQTATEFIDNMNVYTGSADDFGGAGASGTTADTEPNDACSQATTWPATSFLQSWGDVAGPGNTDPEDLYDYSEFMVYRTETPSITVEADMHHDLDHFLFSPGCASTLDSNTHSGFGARTTVESNADETGMHVSLVEWKAIREGNPDHANYDIRLTVFQNDGFGGGNDAGNGPSRATALPADTTAFSGAMSGKHRSVSDYHDWYTMPVETGLGSHRSDRGEQEHRLLLGDRVLPPPAGGNPLHPPLHEEPRRRVRLRCEGCQRDGCGTQQRML